MKSPPTNNEAVKPKSRNVSTAVNVGKKAKTKKQHLRIGCPICLNELTHESVITSTLCGHLFCEGCLSKAIKVQRKCPVCCKNIRTKGYHRVYFN